MSVAQLLVVAGSIVGAILALGAGLALLRNATYKAELEQVRSANASLREYNQDLLSKVTRLESDLANQQQQITALQDLVTGKAELDNLNSALLESRREIAIHEEQALERHRVVVALTRAMYREVISNQFTVLGMLGDRRDPPEQMPGDDDDPPHEDLRPYIPPRARPRT